MPCYNTLHFTMMAYRSIREYYPSNEIIILDDGSIDDSWGWIGTQLKLDDNLRAWHNESGAILGHTILYDLGIKMSKNDLFSIFHSDMICGKGYLENLVKHWSPTHVVCSTRVEPEGIYPPGDEKILKSFGLEWWNFEHEKFNEFVTTEQAESKNKTNPGFFAPWLMSKKDFMDIGGNDAKSFAPYPTEDDDFCLRCCLAGYKLIQSRDSLCFHFISRGHRGWSVNGIKNDNKDFEFYRTRSLRNYLRKWHRWMQFDHFHHPIVHPVYNIGFVLTDVITEDFLYFIEPWATNVYVDNWQCAERYITKEQPTTKIDLRKRMFNHGYIEQNNNDVLLYFSQKDFMADANQNSAIMTTLTDILAQGIENNSEMELGIFKLKTKAVKDIAPTLIKV